MMSGFLALVNEKYILSGFLLACSIAVKLLPLMFVPAIFFYLFKEKKGLVSFFVSLFTVLLIFFIPLFIGIDISHFLSSLDLYFQKFEFNASLYFLVREFGIWVTGYNQIAVLGPLLGLTAMGIIIYLSTSAKNNTFLAVLEICLHNFIIYLISTTTVHPWYLAVPIVLSVFHPRIWILVWSYLIFLSYSLYNEKPIPGIEWLLVLEYAAVMIIWYWEQKKNPPPQCEADFLYKLNQKNINIPIDHVRS